MALPDFSMRQLLEAGVHFGHQTHRWNPKMAPFIFGDRNNIHIIDLAQTVPMLHRAMEAVSETVAKGGRVLFVGTKRQASETVADAARRCAQYYVNSRWLGGMLTNWKTISNSIHRLRQLDEMLETEIQGLTKKERLSLTREREKLDRALGGIRDMGGLPHMLFVVDTNKEAIAIAEARRLNIPVVAVLDSNSDPDGITYPIPGNDDAGRAVALYCDLIARSALEGISRSEGSMGIDAGESEAPRIEAELEETPAANGVDMVAGPVTEESAADRDTLAAGRAAAANPDPESDVQRAMTPDPEQAVEGGAFATGEAEQEAEAESQEAEKGEKTQSDQQSDEPLFARPEGDPDDLKRISGVGPVLEEKLQSLGITTFAQIADLSEDDAARIEERLNFKGRVEREDWIGQAKALVAEG